MQSDNEYFVTESHGPLGILRLKATPGRRTHRRGLLPCRFECDQGVRI